jgi:hypothetical protein
VKHSRSQSTMYELIATTIFTPVILSILESLNLGVCRRMVRGSHRSVTLAQKVRGTTWTVVHLKALLMGRVGTARDVISLFNVASLRSTRSSNKISRKRGTISQLQIPSGFRGSESLYIRRAFDCSTSMMRFKVVMELVSDSYAERR